MMKALEDICETKKFKTSHLKRNRNREKMRRVSSELIECRKNQVQNLNFVDRKWRF